MTLKIPQRQGVNNIVEKANCNRVHDCCMTKVDLHFHQYVRNDTAVNRLGQPICIRNLMNLP